MFDDDLGALPTRDLLEAAAESRAVASQADARVLQCAQIYADRFHPTLCGIRPNRRASDGREKPVVLGGEGCPQIAEFAIAEFAIVLGVSPGVGRQILADSLALRHRFPRTWTQVQAGQATPWKACQIARSCLKLDHAAAAYVDRRVAPIVDTISPYRLDKIVTAAKKHADPDLAETEATDAATDRGVFIGRGDGHGNKTIYIKAAAASVNRYNARIATIADALKTFGDPRPLQHRRAQAVDIICDPLFTQELLTQAQTQTGTHAHADAQSDADAQADAPTDARTEAGTRTNAQTEADAHAQADTQTQAGAQADAQADAQTDGDGSADASPQAQSAAEMDVRAEADGQPRSDPRAEGGVQAEPDFQVDASGHSHPGPADVHASGVSCAGVEDDLLELLDGREPFGPVEDPWLEGSGPPDPDVAVDPYVGRTPVPGIRTGDEPPVDAAALPMDAAALRALDARLAQIKQGAYAACSNSRADGVSRADGAGRGRGQVRPGKTEVVVHLTDQTLANGVGVVRAEGIGPLLAGQLAELVGHGPYTVKPVIDLNDAVSVDAYEIPTRIRERVRLMHPVELFPYGTRETSDTIDLDHIEPYDPHGPTGQTSTSNLAPLGRFGHRVKTHARGWSVHRIDDKTLEWTTPHGFTFHVDPDGTHRVDPRMDPRIDKTAVRRRVGRLGG